MELSKLNKEQREAVEYIDGPLLVLAGAGSGKTRVLVYRIANLIEHGVAPRNILALTFTNKAASAMRERAETLIGGRTDGMWVTTFHSCCARILRMDIDKIGFDRNFVIYDDSDQMSLITEIIKTMGLNDKEISKREIKERISDAKNRSSDPKQYLIELAYADDTVIKVYDKYEKRLKESNALDFDDLLIKTTVLFDQCPAVLEKYRARFRYVLVDEYQDTNMTQYRLVELLCHEHRNICVVGDDDQSIYGWRGADIRNILGFEKDFENTKVIRLEQNYRSTSVILDAANAVIQNNIGRKQKKLWTQKDGGEKITLYCAESERDEAAYMCKRILEGVRSGRSYDEFGVLYRMNAQSRVLEGMLSNYGIPYKVYGGQRFYDRREIKDIMAYLRLIYNPNDDVAFMRIVNVPRRGIGDVTIGEISKAAQENGISMLMTVITGTGMTDKLKSKLKPFADSMTEFIAMANTMLLSEFVNKLMAALEYEKYLALDDKKNELESRLDNIRELAGNIKEIESGLADDVSALQLFLENVALVSDIDSMQDENGTVSLMTLHSAKGLEFDTVFLAGMEENIFPTSRARNDLSSNAIEEERRLCYVGITRARERLHIIHAKQRMLFGDYSYNRRSRFIDEIPPELMDEQIQQLSATAQSSARRAAAFDAMMHPGFGSKQPKAVQAATAVDKQLSLFQKVEHEKFGVGTVMEVSGTGSAMMVTIDFQGTGVKRFAAAYAPITVINDTEG
ncbi:MAG: UvrD-helicase domain-containing protein [Clostridia bacterium]